MKMLIPLLLALTAAVPDKPAPKPTAAQIADSAPASSWGEIVPDDLMVMDFADGQRAVIWLAPEFARVHVANIKAIARSGFWRDATIYRVQDNYVTQWGGGEDKAPPAGINATPPAEYEWPASAHPFVRNPYKDAYASVTGFTPSGWAVAGDGMRQWLPHCYGMVGVARDLAPSVGTGADLYTVIGHAPRHLDRNIAVVGRVIDGMGALSARPRGTGGGLGLYEDKAKFIPIQRIAIASDLPAAALPHFQYFKPSAPEFARILEARANRGLPFFEVPAGAADLCNLPVPVRKKG